MSCQGSGVKLAESFENASNRNFYNIACLILGGRTATAFSVNSLRPHTSRSSGLRPRVQTQHSSNVGTTTPQPMTGCKPIYSDSPTKDPYLPKGTEISDWNRDFPRPIWGYESHHHIERFAPKCWLLALSAYLLPFVRRFHPLCMPYSGIKIPLYSYVHNSNLGDTLAPSWPPLWITRPTDF